MRIVIEDTEHLVTLDGVRCRVWRGVSDHGVGCLVYVHRIAVRNGEHAPFDRELEPQPHPREIEGEA